ncbi:hypothetical protein GLOIN_2v1587390 [Rhizophagus clarus]|uniref:SAM domain-containing protein n=1 Tax=Rhizophagus clarus TaxID=94130 RepID=A0A8H3KU04_9GLOM|nr:hypothetical protein GLOIN_2v1587390 [Rhizophagus clarus]
MTDIVDTPVSTSSTTATGNETLTLADEIVKYDTEALISFLQERGLELSETAIKILEKEEIDGCAFLKLSKQDFRDYGMPGGPTIKLVDFSKECKEKLLRAFSTYRSLKEVLEKYDLASEGTEIIPLFTPRIHEIPDENKHLELCMADIKLRLKSYGTLVITSLESMRNEYVSTILHTALRIAEDITKKKFSMRPEYEIIGDGGSIMQSRNPKTLFASQKIRDWHFHLYSPGEILQASKAPFSIEFVEEALVENSEEYKTLRKGVKKVLGIIIGLLEDRACVEDKSDRKRARIEGYRLKK